MGSRKHIKAGQLRTEPQRGPDKASASERTSQSTMSLAIAASAKHACAPRGLARG